MIDCQTACHRARADDSEGVVGLESRLARRSEDGPDLVLHAVEPRHAALRAHEDREPAVGAQDLHEKRDGNEQNLVACLAQHLPETLLHADHAHGIAANQQGAADGIDAGEDLVLDVGADDRDRGGVRLLARTEEAAGLDVEVEHGVHVGRVAGDLDTPELAPPRLDGGASLACAPTAAQDRQLASTSLRSVIVSGFLRFARRNSERLLRMPYLVNTRTSGFRFTRFVATNWFRPLMTETTATTVMTPMMTPRSVNPERSLWLPSVRNDVANSSRRSMAPGLLFPRSSP